MVCAGSRARVELRHGPVAVRAAIESMNGARFVHDTLERCGWEVEVADAQKVKGLAPLACKTDRIDAWVLAELSRRDLVPAIWLPTLRAARRARARALAAVLGAQALGAEASRPRPAVGVRAPLPGVGPVRPPGPRAARAPGVPRARGAAGCSPAVAMIDDLDRQIAAIDRELRALGADHAYVPLLMTVPGDRVGARLHDRLRDRRHPAASLTRRSCAATPACARASTSPATPTAAARSPTPARSTCAGR